MFGLSSNVFFLLVGISLINKELFVCSRLCEQDFNLKIAYCSNLLLKSVPTYLLPDLRQLYLEGNLLTLLKNDTFVHYPSLRELSLNNNNISNIEGATFTPLKNLERLDLGYNPYLPTLTKNMFDSKSISNFNAVSSNLESFTGDILTCFVQSTILSLFSNNLRQINWTSFNPLYDVNLGENRFRHISKETFVINDVVLTLDLSGNPIEYIEATFISSIKASVIYLRNTRIAIPQLSNFMWGVRLSKRIKEFRINGAKLHTIDPGFFAPLRGKNLDKVDIGLNGLRIVQNSLTDLTGVSQLLLDSNDLDEIKPSQFNGMFALCMLSLEDNQIITINSQDDTWNLSVTHLNIARNELGEINSSAFQGLKTIQILDLSGNTKLHVIGKNTFANMHSLRKLDLSSTRVIDLYAVNNLPSLTILILKSGYCSTALIKPGNLGRETPSLAELNLVNSALESKKLWDSKNKISSFVHLYNLSRLELSNNPVFPLPVGLFRNLSNLKMLRLDDCLLSELNIGLFNDLENLVLLSLERNLFTFITQGIFDAMKSLRELFLDGNELTYLSSHLFKYSTSLVFLDISDNRMSGLNKSTFEPLGQLHMLNLAANPLVCSCDLQWLPIRLKGSVEIINSIDTICLDTPSTLEPFRGKQLITFDPSEDCSLNIALYCCLVLVGVTLVLTLGLAYYQRWWIKYRLFLLKLCFVGYDEVRDDIDRRQYIYDIAIMLHDDDNEWVNRHLRPALADRLPDYDRIVCGDEELMIGMHYLDAVHYAVEKSFKTIFIISPEALQDQWYILKFRTALEYINDVITEKMTLLFVEDIDEAQLPFLIRLFLSDHRPYLVWPDNERGQHYFWEELVKDLTVNVRCNHLVPP